jgi:WD40 repeat protein
MITARCSRRGAVMLIASLAALATAIGCGTTSRHSQQSPTASTPTPSTVTTPPVGPPASKKLALDATSVTWASGGALISFAGRPKGSPEADDSLWMMRADGTQTRWLACCGDDQSSLSPSGRVVAEPVYNGTGSQALILKTPTGTRLKTLQLHVPPYSDLYGPTWSPDGRSLAIEVDTLASGHGSTFSSIFVAVADRGVRSISDRPFFQDGKPSWSPDGRRIAFVTCRLNAKEKPLGCNLMLMRTDGMQRTTVRRHAGDFTLEPVWSPDGRWLAFTREFGPPGIYVVRRDGSGFRRLAATGSSEGRSSVAWSPDSKRLVFSGPEGLFVAPVSGGGAVHLTSKGRNTWVSWSPAKRIVFTDDAIYVLTPGKRPVRIRPMASSGQ